MATDVLLHAYASADLKKMGFLLGMEEGLKSEAQDDFISGFPVQSRKAKHPRQELETHAWMRMGECPTEWKAKLQCFAAVTTAFAGSAKSWHDQIAGEVHNPCVSVAAPREQFFKKMRAAGANQEYIGTCERALLEEADEASMKSAKEKALGYIDMFQHAVSSAQETVCLVCAALWLREWVRAK